MIVLIPGYEKALAQELLRLESLVNDVRALSTGWLPDSEYLADAPIMMNPRIGYVREACLEGLTIGHPLLGSKTITTSSLLVYAPQQGWARTFSRFYRLRGTMQMPDRA